jgi:DNA-binding transcriptional MocR family regulator
VSETKYEQTAGQLKAMIEKSFKAGDKLPSLRTTAVSFGQSRSTVIKAYGILEKEGLVEVKDRSGYYVRYKPEKRGRITGRFAPKAFDKSALALCVLNSLSDSSLINLGDSFPDKKLLPEKAFSKAAAAIFSGGMFPGIDYLDPQGDYGLRLALSAHLAAKGYACPADRLIITGSNEDSLAAVLSAILSPGETVAVESPAQPLTYLLTASAGLNIVEIPVAETGLDTDYLKKACESTKLKALISSPAFGPKGFSFPVENRKSIVETAKTYGLTIIETDCLSDTAFDGEISVPLSSFYENSVYLSSFAKTIAPGFTLSWIGTGAYFCEIMKAKAAAAKNVPVFTQRILESYLGAEKYKKHIKKFRSEIAANTADYKSAVKKYFPENTEISSPSGGTALWVRVRGLDSVKLFNEAKKEGISIMPGAAFSGNDTYDDCLSVSCGTLMTKTIKEALKTLGGLTAKLL